MGQAAEGRALSSALRDRRTDGRTAALGSISQCQDPALLAPSQHCYFWLVKGFQGLGWTGLPWAASPCSQAVCAGSWLAAGRDKRQQAGAG